MEGPEARKAIEEVFKNLSSEDKQELRRCQRNGFIVGCVWGLTVHSLRQIAVQYNKIKNPTFGRNLSSFVVNFILGYITYAPICASKTVEPLIRKRMLYNKPESDYVTELPAPMEENLSFQSTIHPDMEGPDTSFSHLSLSYESNPADNLVLEDEEETVKPKFQTTYEDLRRQNREGYRVKNFPSEGIAPPSQPVREMPSKPAEPPKRVKTNQYGDPVE